MTDLQILFVVIGINLFLFGINFLRTSKIKDILKKSRLWERVTFSGYDGSVTQDDIVNVKKSKRRLDLLYDHFELREESPDCKSKLVKRE